MKTCPKCDSPLADGMTYTFTCGSGFPEGGGIGTYEAIGCVRRQRDAFAARLESIQKEYTALDASRQDCYAELEIARRESGRLAAENEVLKGRVKELEEAGDYIATVAMQCGATSDQLDMWDCTRDKAKGQR